MPITIQTILFTLDAITKEHPKDKPDYEPP